MTTRSPPRRWPPGRDHAAAAGRRAGALPAAAGPGGRPRRGHHRRPAAGVLALPRGRGAGRGGFADFPLISYHFAQAGTVSATLIPVFYAAAMTVSGTGSLVLGRIFDRAGIGVLIPLTVVAAAYAPLVFLGGFWAAWQARPCGGWGWGCRSRSSPPRSPRWSPRTGAPPPTGRGKTTLMNARGARSPGMWELRSRRGWQR